MCSDFEEILMNIEIFCRILADKISGVRKSCVKPEPIEKLLRRKAVIEVCEKDFEGREPLIDFFEDEKQIKILALTQPPNNGVTLNPNVEFTEVIIGGHLKIKLPIKTLDLSKVHVNSNNWTLEIIIEKTTPTITYVSN
ncbi:MAG: hypothetical protein QXX99_07245 [Candidatus Bathyarchaeia archaeon]